MKILIATTNPGKRAELIQLLEGFPLEIHTPDQISLNLDVEEIGASYAENARLKAHAFCQAAQMPVIADDTGLEVFALDGSPGLHSARYLAAPYASDADRRKKLIQDLNPFPRPWLARFVCSVALALPDGEIYESFGECQGEIIPQERGENGFGYDRIFLFADLQQTMAELPMEIKNQISHRARAIQALQPTLARLTLA